MQTFIFTTIAIALFGGLSVRFLARKLLRTPSWPVKACLALPVFIQTCVIIGTCALLAYLLLHQGINSVEIYMATMIYAISVFLSATIFFVTVAVYFHQNIARSPFKKLKSLGVFILCMLLFGAVMWLLSPA